MPPIPHSNERTNMDKRVGGRARVGGGGGLNGRTGGLNLFHWIQTIYLSFRNDKQLFGSHEVSQSINEFVMENKKKKIITDKNYDLSKKWTRKKQSFAIARPGYPWV